MVEMNKSISYLNNYINNTLMSHTIFLAIFGNYSFIKLTYFYLMLSL